jgi:hypothetical protein
MVAIALALASSLTWGVADFSGGLLTRRVPLAAVTIVSQAAGFGALLHERISPVQRLGVAVALVGVAVVSAA